MGFKLFMTHLYGLYSICIQVCNRIMDNNLFGCMYSSTIYKQHVVYYKVKIYACLNVWLLLFYFISRLIIQKVKCF